MKIGDKVRVKNRQSGFFGQEGTVKSVNYCAPLPYTVEGFEPRNKYMGDPVPFGHKELEEVVAP